MEVRLEQPAKAHAPMLVTEFGISTEVRRVQPKKAIFPILVTEFPMLMEVRFEHFQKA
jgi:hypothetical protein